MKFLVILLSIMLAIWAIPRISEYLEHNEVVPFEEGQFFKYQTGNSYGTIVKYEYTRSKDGKWIEKWKVDMETSFRDEKFMMSPDRRTENVLDDFGRFCKPQGMMQGKFAIRWLPVKYRKEGIIIKEHYIQRAVVAKRRLWEKWDVFPVEMKFQRYKEVISSTTLYYEASTGWLVGWEEAIPIVEASSKQVLIDTNIDIPILEKAKHEKKEVEAEKDITKAPL